MRNTNGAAMDVVASPAKEEWTAFEVCTSQPGWFTCSSVQASTCIRMTWLVSAFYMVHPKLQPYERSQVNKAAASCSCRRCATAWSCTRATPAVWRAWWAAAHARRCARASSRACRLGSLRCQSRAARRRLCPPSAPTTSARSARPSAGRMPRRRAPNRCSCSIIW